MQLRKIIHLELKGTSPVHKYYGSLVALYRDNENLGVSHFTLAKKDLEAQAYENKICIVRKGTVMTSGNMDAADK